MYVYITIRIIVNLKLIHGVYNNSNCNLELHFIEYNRVNVCIHWFGPGAGESAYHQHLPADEGR